MRGAVESASPALRAKRWLARIMFTWGLLAAAMMFVRTPWQFYGVRLLLGMAEAGFFPALSITSRSGSRRNAGPRGEPLLIALPLSSVLMGALAGWLLGLQGNAGSRRLAMAFSRGRLARGRSSASSFSGCFPTVRCKAAWLTPEERMWLKRQLEADSAQAHLGHEAGVMQALLSPKVWMIGAYFLCALTANYAYGFSAPAILQEATGWSVTQGWISDCGFRSCRRCRHAAERRAFRSQR